MTGILNSAISTSHKLECRRSIADRRRPSGVSDQLTNTNGDRSRAATVHLPSGAMDHDFPMGAQESIRCLYGSGRGPTTDS